MSNVVGPGKIDPNTWRNKPLTRGDAYDAILGASKQLKTRSEVILRRMPKSVQKISKDIVQTSVLNVVFFAEHMAKSIKNGKCVYTIVWTDEVGNVDVCVYHGQNSKHPSTEGANRPCLEVDPY